MSAPVARAMAESSLSARWHGLRVGWPLNVFQSMQNLDEEEDEIFLDSLEFQSPASDSASTGDPSISDYQVWTDDLRSIRERRSKFLRKMHYEGMALSSPEIERFRSFEHDMARESSDPDLDSISQEDRGEKLLAIELAEKIESGRLIIWEKMNLSLGFPQQFQKKKNPRRFWSCFSGTGGILGELCKRKPERIRSKLENLRKGEKKFSSMSMVQEFTAHKGAITSLKFSPDGRYLATGGEDCVVNIWRAVEEQEEEDDCQLAIGGEFLESSRSYKLAETPLHELHGHRDGVLDLSWSESNHLISSSKDKTVRLWRASQDHCLQIFHHSNYVTCVQFNPVDEGQFISGSIDGKVRIWGVSEARVVDWVDFGDIITAVCYRPDGQGFVAGSVSGDCRFYSSGEILQLDREVRLPGRKKPTGKTITGFQFSPHEPEKIMITSSDGKLRIYDGVAEIMNKFKVPGRSKGQFSAIFTSDGRFIVSVGEDSSVSIWDQVMSNQEKSALPRECFLSEAASHAAVRPRQSPIYVSSGRARPASVREAESFSLGAWFIFADFPARVSATWPEENFSLCKAHLIRDVVTASHDGVIRSFRGSGPLDPILLHPRDWKRERKRL